jgi:hypothetical protein
MYFENYSEETVVKKYLEWLKLFKMKKEEQFYFYLILSHVVIGNDGIFTAAFTAKLYVYLLTLTIFCDEDPKQKS